MLACSGLHEFESHDLGNFPVTYSVTYLGNFRRILPSSHPLYASTVAAGFCCGCCCCGCGCGCGCGY